MKLTPYQQSILDQGRRTSWPVLAASCAVILCTALLAAGYVFEGRQELSPVLRGWLLVGTVLLLVAHGLGVAAVALFAAVLPMGRWLLKEARRNPWDADLQKNAYAPRQLVVLLASRTRVGTNLTGPAHVMDRLATLALFGSLMYALHPVLAVLLALLIVAQEAGLRVVRAMLLDSLRLIDDPLDADGPVDIDALMDKLVAPDEEA